MNSSAGRAFRPCPFPVYDADLQRPRVEVTLRTVLLLAVLSVFLPNYSGPGAESGTPVFWKRVSLDSRAPVAVVLDWDAAEFQVSPPSLGFFDDDNRFLFSGDAARGLIYGMYRDQVLIVEIEAATDSELYMDDYLEAIRAKVAISNNIKNDLLLARRATPGAQAADAAFDRVWDEVRPDLTGSADFLWPDKVLSSYPGMQARIEARLGAEARHIARLKELYYLSQEARLELLVAQHDLQLALTRYPHQEIPVMENLTDRKVAREAMLGELARISTAWTTRRDELSRDLATAGYWLNVVENGRAGIQQQSSSTLAGRIWGQPHIPEEQLASAELSPRQRLEISLVQARIVVANSELSMLEQVQGRLDPLIRHVNSGIAQPGAVAEVRVARTGLASVKALQLSHADQLNGLVASADNGLQVIEFFAARFNEPGKEINLPDREPFRQPTFPNEIPLCLAAAELMLRMDRVAPAPEPAMEDDASGLEYEPGIEGQLEQVSLFPENYTPVSHHLSFIQFVSWYLDRI